MHKSPGTILALAVLICGANVAHAQDPTSSLVLVFRDGHQRSFTASEVARIEFDPTRVVLKNGHEESFAPREIVRIEMKNFDENGVLGRNHFVGKWRVGDGAGSHFFINLQSDGSASKTIGARHGRWTLVNGQARISWDDGWHDAICKVGETHEKRAFAPGKRFDEAPSNVADAEIVNLEPI